jgi:uracil-DNA glycosylase family 4
VRKAQLSAIERDIVACRLCPRLVRHREKVAGAAPRRYRGQSYWARPLPGFGDPEARLLVVGLAPAAHGGNRTGRMFTGDRSGDWLYEALYRFGFASQARSTGPGDGLALRDAFITAAARCAPPGNKPTAAELLNCRPYLERELALLTRLRVVVTLGRIAFDSFLAVWRERGRSLPAPRPRFAHGRVARLPDGVLLIASYHPSQQNTFTGRLTRAMFHRVFRKARRAL